MEKYHISSIWDKVADPYHRISILSKPHSARLEKVAGFILEKKFHKIFDLGCGSGILEKYLISHGFIGEIEAIDNSSAMLNIATKTIRSATGVSFKLNDMDTGLDAQSNSMDCIVAINTMYLVKDKVGFLSDVKRILKPDGYFILVDPKPHGGIFPFIKEHFLVTHPSNTVKDLCKLTNLVDLIRVILAQMKVDSFFKHGVISYQGFDEIIAHLSNSGFMIEISEETQARQNWFFISKIKK
ncbi:MAG: methyltransferase type 11 [uncultured bacterium]|nr:MAG: methyltransferase type 11 [uncultured bacterium]